MFNGVPTIKTPTRQPQVSQNQAPDPSGGMDALKSKIAQDWFTTNPNPNYQVPASIDQNTQLATGYKGDVGGGNGQVGPSAAATQPLFSSLDSLGGILANKNAGSQADYAKAIAGYDESDALDRTAYDTNTAQNETTFTGNNQKALLNAANASTGLRGVLSSLRALGGSGMNIVNKLVGLAANSDTGNARDTFETNATGLNTAWSGAEQEQRQRRDDAVSLRDNNLQNNEADVLGSRQTIYNQLANLYGDGTARGNEYAGKSSALSAPIAATTKRSVSPYAKRSSTFSPDALKSYLAGTQNLNVSTDGSSSTPINSPVYEANRKDRLSGVA